MMGKGLAWREGAEEGGNMREVIISVYRLSSTFLEAL
jgi:hypothetical protein